MLRRISGGIGRSWSNGPPGASRIMKKLSVMMISSVGTPIASRRRIRRDMARA